MKSLQIDNGDLVLGPGGYATVEGTQRVRQDLGLAMREPYGIDRFHPRYGSLLDSYVGIVITSDTPVLIEAEAKRVVANFVALQQRQLQKDVSLGRPSRYKSSEVVIGVGGVSLTQQYDRLSIKVVLDTLGHVPVEINSQVVT